MDQIKKISEDYFGYMAKNFPVMCLSDEFYFFPRAKKAVKFLNLLDGLDEEKIKENTSYVKNLKSSLGKLDSKTADLERQIDLAVLNQSMSTFLREFEEIKVWQTDPSLYLKILFLGIDHILTRFSNLLPDSDHSLASRIAQIPRLLNEAKNNLSKVPLEFLEVAVEMVDSSIDYFKTASLFVKNKNTLLEPLEDFKRFLTKKPPSGVFIRDRELVENILKSSFSYARSLEEIFEIASMEYQNTLKELKKVAESVNPKKTWQEILSSASPGIKDVDKLLGLYSAQIEKLKNFLKDKNLITIPRTQNILVKFTPEFMEPVRASASYSTPLTDDIKESAYFYITADTGIHNEYLFVTAHETYPGHHLLDSIRRRLNNSIRQQIESPLFYEGWASYAEKLIDQLGFIKNPVQRLPGLKRRAWRAVRAMLDVGISTNKLKLEDSGKLLEDLGYEPRIVKRMLRHYALTPGYQLCYTIGKFEIDRLKEKFSSRLGLKKFHDFLLEGGQIPFDLIEKRMEKLCKKSF